MNVAQQFLDRIYWDGFLHGLGAGLVVGLALVVLLLLCPRKP